MCHVGKEDDRKKLIEKTVENYGGIDILVSNAATNPNFGNIFDVNLKKKFSLKKSIKKN